MGGSEAMTYFEKGFLGYGTAYERFGKESLGNFDDCQLTLKPAIDPVCTPQGIIYSKDAILDYLIHEAHSGNQKKSIEINKMDEFIDLEKQMKLREFELINNSGVSNCKFKTISEKIFKDTKRLKKTSQITVNGALNNEVNQDRIKDVNLFWSVISNPEAELFHSLPQVKTKKTCPITGKKLNFKNLTPLKFTLAPTSNKDTKKTYMDPLTKDIFTNRSRLICVRPTGDVMLYEVYKNCVEPFGLFRGYRILNTDIIELQKGGTGYAIHDGKKSYSSKHTYLGLGSGMTDLRGQHSGSATKAGLVLI